MWTSRCRPATDDRRCVGGYCHACEGCDTHCDCANTEEVRHTAPEFPDLMSAVRWAAENMREARTVFITWRSGALRVSAARPVTEPYAFAQFTPRGCRITNDPALLTLN